MTRSKSKIYLTIGMMWFQEVENPLAAIADAATYYLQKYGEAPQYCHINPSAFKRNRSTFTQTGGKMKIIRDKSIQPHHYWLGVVR